MNMSLIGLGDWNGTLSDCMIIDAEDIRRHRILSISSMVYGRVPQDIQSVPQPVTLFLVPVPSIGPMVQ